MQGTPELTGAEKEIVTERECLNKNPTKPKRDTNATGHTYLPPQ